LKGVAHFYFGIGKAKTFYSEMMEKLGDYLVPKLIFKLGSNKKNIERCSLMISIYELTDILQQH
jgi:hypothetical protein